MICHSWYIFKGLVILSYVNLFFLGKRKKKSYILIRWSYERCKMTSTYKIFQNEIFLNQWNAVYKIQIMQQCQLTISPIIFIYKNLCILSSNCIVLVKRDVQDKLLIFTREQMPSFHVANNFSYFFLEDKIYVVIVCNIKGSHQRCDLHHHQDIDSTTNNNGSYPSPIEHTFLENSSGRTFQSLSARFLISQALHYWSHDFES